MAIMIENEGAAVAHLRRSWQQRSRSRPAGGPRRQSGARPARRLFDRELGAPRRQGVAIPTRAGADHRVPAPIPRGAGIMASFHGIGQQGSANPAVVAPGISEALIATAAGLAAATPAVIAYNYFVNRVKHWATEMEGFTMDLLNLVARPVPKLARKDGV